MYKIIGGDQREYGPVTAEQVRDWIAQNRANAQTLAQVQGSSAWQPLGSLPEFANALAGQCPPPVPPRLSKTTADALANAIRARDYHLKIGACFSRGWELLKQRFWLLVCATAVVTVALLIAHALPAGGLIGALLCFPLCGGLNWLFLKLVRGGPASFEDAFAGFKLAFVPLLLASAVSTALIFVGLITLILPAIYLIVCYMLFVPLLILDKRLDFWPAMELSRRVVTQHWFKVFWLLVVSLLVTAAGFLALGVGVFITLPLATAATVYAYEDIFNAAAGVLAPVAVGPLPTGPVEPLPTSAA
jgi:hypothetical protein